MFVCATGFLHKPLLPDIPGRESFAGPSFHSARWDHSVPYAGKRWGVIGSGASGVQITEALAWAGCDVTQFIRRAQWVHIRENPHSTWHERLKLRLPGGYAREQRRLWQFINENDRWRLEPGPQREYAAFLDYVKDPELKKKLTPDYNLGCTRILKSDKNYYEAVQLPNARIVKGHIDHIEPDAVVMADGTRVALDVLVYVTGFDAHAYMRPMNVTGLNGISIDEAWRERIYSYGGIALPGFPNLFTLYGPFAPVNNVPVPLGLDQEIACIMRLIAEVRARRAVVAPTTAATEKFLARLGTAFPDTVWVGGCKNWYTSRQPTPVLWPFPQSEQRRFSSGCRSKTSISSRSDRERDRLCALPQKLLCPRALRFGEKASGAASPKAVMTDERPMCRAVYRSPQVNFAANGIGPSAAGSRRRSKISRVSANAIKSLRADSDASSPSRKSVPVR